MKTSTTGPVVTITVLLAGACGGPPPGSGPSRATAPASPAPTARDGSIISGCAMRVRDEMEKGLGSRAVRVGPAAFVPFGIHAPRGRRAGAVGNFKVMVELAAGARVTVRLPAEAAGGLSLMFDRGRLRPDNAYTLTEGARAVRFEACPDRPATFVGSVLTAGPDRARLEVTVEGGPTRRIELIAASRPQ